VAVYCGAVTATGLRARVGASSLTIGGLLKHLAVVEDYTFTVKLSGQPIGDPWRPVAVHVRRRRHAGTALRLLGRRGRALPRTALADGGLDRPVHLSWPDGRQASLRRLVCDLVEEYGRHTGHADLLREAVDGRVGEDPPPGWRPVS
jgi:hypothetical protein